MADGWKGYMRRSVVVNLKDGTAFSGVLWAHQRPLLVLRNATRHEGADRSYPVDGEVVIDTGNVAFTQALAEPVL